MYCLPHLSMSVNLSTILAFPYTLYPIRYKCKRAFSTMRLVKVVHFTYKYHRGKLLLKNREERHRDTETHMEGNRTWVMEALSTEYMTDVAITSVAKDLEFSTRDPSASFFS